MSTEVVVDTNVLISGLLSFNSFPAQIVDKLLARQIVARYDQRILEEYKEVLTREHFSFSRAEVDALLNAIRLESPPVVTIAITKPWVDEDDKKFYEVSVACGAKLITGNAKHYPKEDIVISPAQFINNAG